MSKSPEMERLLNNLTRTFPLSRAEARDERRCVTCGGNAKEFRDRLSRKEYEISLMCQPCQDGVFDE